jgi:hypothetical protein
MSTPTHPPTPPDRLTARRGRTDRLDPAQAVAHLREQIDQPGVSAVLYFATPGCDFPQLARHMHRAFACPVIGCTTAGEITSEHGHACDGIVAVSIASPALAVHPALLEPDDIADPARLRARIRAALDQRVLNLGDRHCFATLIADGLSMSEERLAAGAAASLAGIPLVGGSAGDNLAFQTTRVALDDRTLERGAVLALFETAHPFHLFHAHHFRPGEERLVITGADPDTRRVREINGLPAAVGYARAIARDPRTLTPETFSAHPVMLLVGGQYYIRSIQRVHDDGSLTFFCAIDNGLVLRVGRGGDIADGYRAQVEAIRRALPDLSLTIGFDCVLRRLELRSRGLDEPVRRHLENAEFIGFSTYGEQINGLHVNQTITGVALGNAA